MKKEDFAYLKHILDSIYRIEDYIQEIEYEDFMDNHLLQDGVIRQLEIIGEATKMLSREIKEKYPNISWKDMAGMRDKLIHGYFGVDLDAVWDTAKKDVPRLRNEIEKIMENEKET
ncbi:MAG: hypothetical protein COS08_00390 [Euryarchaeota archaeon CG01_land_8_20_14_3_00_38_12]|nr:MAG: hypothetical protein COS08_00390 [Euryarchaeota archaeon CG01_land_8_20_14_3_00_38_12]PJB21446.1 MAG: hypothetical protein CO114_05265 [Euryarchaeota archaeon CG_4_9_14_3_um_filter_38_12]